MSRPARRLGAVAAWVFMLPIVSCAGVPPRPDLLALEHKTAQLRVPSRGPITILALGDTGKGTQDQARVAAAARDLCARLGCDLGFLLGDNIYDRGIARVEDPRFDEVMSVYDTFGFPFLVVLGNHDYGSPFGVSPLGGLGVEENRALTELYRVAGTKNLHMPGRHWRVDLVRLEVVGLDTQPFFWMDQPAVAEALGLKDDVERQQRDLRIWNLASEAPFRIALGHHPLMSAGPHGDAGRADGAPTGLVFSAEHIRQLLETHIVGHFDMYLAGHDHNVQDVGTRRGTELLVSGGGAEKKPVRPRDDVLFAQETLGFIVLEVEPEARRAEVQLYGVDEAGVAARIHARTVQH